jgi:hypothetical protein
MAGFVTGERFEHSWGEQYEVVRSTQHTVTLRHHTVTILGKPVDEIIRRKRFTGVLDGKPYDYIMPDNLFAINASDFS